VHLDDTPEVVPASDWQYNAAGTAISLTGVGGVNYLGRSASIILAGSGVVIG
jgi:hypothetical protein